MEAVDCTCCGEEMSMSGLKVIANEELPIKSAGPSQERAMVNSEERIADIKRWREVMDSGMNIEYRCVAAALTVAMLTRLKRLA